MRAIFLIAIGLAGCQAAPPDDGCAPTIEECLDGQDCTPRLPMTIGTPEGEPFATCTGRSVPANNPCEGPMSVRAGYSPDGTRVRITLYGARWMDLHGARYWIDAPIFPAQGDVVHVCEETYDDLWGGCGGPARVTECATSGLLTIDWNASGHVIAIFEDGSSFEARW